MINIEEIKDLKVLTLKDVMETLQLLIEKYKFNIDVLSKLLDENLIMRYLQNML